MNSDRAVEMPVGTSLEDVRRTLQRAQRRERVWFSVRAIAWFVTSALLAWSVVVVVEPPWDTATTPLLIAAGVLLIVCVLVIVYHVRKSVPGIIDLARRADVQFALKERISTAFEVEAGLLAPPQDAGLRQSLIHDAETHGRAIDPARLRPFHVPHAVWTVPLAVLAVVIVELGVHTAVVAPTGGSARGSSVLTEVQAEAVNERLALIEDQLHTLAELEDDRYLEAVAQAFDELAARVDKGDVSTSELAAELSDLLQHVERRTGSVAGTLDGQGHQRVGSEFEEPPIELLQSRVDEAAVPSSPGRLSESEAFADAMRDLDELEAGLVELIDTRARQRIRPESLAQSYDAIQPPSAGSSEPSESQAAQEGAPAGEPVGAAQEANRGEGDIAGAGARPVGEGVDGDDRMDPDQLGREDVQLPDGRLSEGDRVRQEFAPRASGDEPTLVQGQPPMVDFRYAEESASRHVLLDPAAREVAAKYFEPQRQP